MPLAAALVQLNASDDPAANLPETERLVREAAAGGARLVLTPEVTNIVSASRSRQSAVLAEEDADETLARLRAVAAETGIWLSIGSLALKAGGGETRFVNRQFLVAPTERSSRATTRSTCSTWPSAARSSIARARATGRARRRCWRRRPSAPWGSRSATICGFPALYRALAEAGRVDPDRALGLHGADGAGALGGAAARAGDRDGLFRARRRAMRPAQRGGKGRERQTWGHSLAVAPWGEVLADGGETPGVTHVSLDLDAVADARARVPSLANARAFSLARAAGTVEAG